LLRILEVNRIVADCSWSSKRFVHFLSFRTGRRWQRSCRWRCLVSRSENFLWISIYLPNAQNSFCEY